MAAIKHKQSGFIILLGMLLLVLGAASWFGFYGNIKSTSMQLKQDDLQKSKLHHIKERMLTYAVLHPELYFNQVNPANTPGMGYFPCPDTNGDGAAESICGRNPTSSNDQLFVLGRVPLQITGIDFNFVDTRDSNELYWFAYDARMVNNSQSYAVSPNNRFAELNIRLPNSVNDATGTSVPPLTLDGRDDIVMVLFYAGDDDLANGPVQNRPSNNVNDYLEQGAINSDGNTYNFVSTDGDPEAFNDYVIAITRNEWERALLKRLTLDLDEDGYLDICVPTGPVASLPSTPPLSTPPVWMQACTYDATLGNLAFDPSLFTCNADTVDNLIGQGWAEILDGC